ncbi:MAG: outer membrane lipoprotein-sorting protein [Verrucomicrobiales bacterium]|nr:outer membrane lipoprotein-sorting protein [Verrucomicrobiales bacterium]
MKSFAKTLVGPMPTAPTAIPAVGHPLCSDEPAAVSIRPLNAPAWALRWWLALVCGLGVSVGAAESRDAARGQALAASVRSQRPATASVTTGTLRVRAADGRRLSLPVEVRVALGTNGAAWSTVYNARFPDGRRESLTVVNPENAAPHFILHRASGDGRVTESRPERPDEMFAAFAGTDFWFVDLGMVFLHWPEQRVTGRETRRTRTCDVLESVNPQVAAGGYRRVLTWVDVETGGIVRAEAYDAQDRLLKEFSPGSFARVGSRYELRDMEIRDDQTDSRTTLQFDIEDPAKLGVQHLPTEK